MSYGKFGSGFNLNRGYHKNHPLGFPRGTVHENIGKTLGVKLFLPIFVKVKLHQNSYLSNILCCTCNLITKAQKFTGAGGVIRKKSKLAKTKTPPLGFSMYSPVMV